MARSAETLVPEILQEIPVLLYNGADDLICNWMGTQTWSVNMKWPGQQNYIDAANQTFILSNQKSAGWFKAATASGSKQLTWLIINEAGHMVPFNQPQVRLGEFLLHLAKWANTLVHRVHTGKSRDDLSIH